MRHTRSWIGVLTLSATALTLTGSTTSHAAADPLAAWRTQRPVIDTGYLYGQLYSLSTNDIYRASGLDGPPQNPADPANQPPTLNGWQEFYAQWKHQMTSRDAMGPLARYVTVADHYFRVQGFPYDSNVAEVTIPGATCPGQRVLLAGHPDSTPVRGSRIADLIDQGNFTRATQVLNSSNLGNGSPYDDTSGVTMGMAEFQALARWWAATGNWPARTVKIGLFDAEETGLNGSFYYAANLIPAGPQGQYVLVANMDQNGMEYPAYHWGTDHYLNDVRNGGVGPWYTNINASPLAPNDIYKGDDWARIQANMPAILRFRAALQDSVTQAFTTLGDRYHHSVPLEGHPIYNQPGNPPPPTSATAYTPADQARYSPVQDDTLGRTDQVPFVAQGIPGFGVLGAFDTNPTENPYPANYASKPVINQYAGYDTMGDTIEHLNFWAAGVPHGPKGVADPAVELRRALELPATWTDYLVSRPEYAGSVKRPHAPVAYFETDPVNGAATDLTVHFDGRFSADAGNSGRLTYLWDFGDGTYGTGATVSHTYAGPRWADAKLVTVDRNGHVGTYRQAVKVAGGGTGSAPTTDACGLLSSSDTAKVRSGAAHHDAATPWTPTAADFTTATPVQPHLSAEEVQH
jgi:hypothetical protein